MITMKEAGELMSQYHKAKEIDSKAAVKVLFLFHGQDDMLSLPAGTIGCDPETNSLFFTCEVTPDLVATLAQQLGMGGISGGAAAPTQGNEQLEEPVAPKIEAKPTVERAAGTTEQPKRATTPAPAAKPPAKKPAAKRPPLPQKPNPFAARKGPQKK